MINTKNNVQTKPYTKYIFNTALIGGGAGLGVLYGLEKNKDDVVAVEKILLKKYSEYRTTIHNNKMTIADKFVRQAQDDIAKNKFNSTCDFAYNHYLKKLKIKNVVLGALIGGAIGAVGVVAKTLYKKKKEQNANISNISSNKQ